MCGVAERSEKQHPHESTDCQVYIVLTEHQAGPGKILTMVDGWTADKTKGLFLGVTAHWIKVKSGVWLWSEVVAFQGVSGEHTGLNLGWYFVGGCDHVGITGQDKLKVILIDHLIDKITD